MAGASIPLIAALPNFGAAPQPSGSNDLIAANPALQALLSQTGGWRGTQNVNAMAASSPQMGQMLSMMSPGGGISPQMAQQFGPLFALLMSLGGSQSK